MALLNATKMRIFTKDVAVSIWDEHSYQVPDNLDDLLYILGINSCSARLMLQYAFNQLNVSLVTIGLLLLSFHVNH